MRNYKSYLLSFFIIISCLSVTGFSQSGLVLYQAETAAQAHCPQDRVVWLNLPSGIWHYRGTRWYGRTKHGAFVCLQEAATAGNRASLNGQ